MISEGIKGAIELLIREGEGKFIKENIHGATYTNKNLERIQVPMANAIKTTTLTSIVDYIKENVDSSSDENIIIHVESYNEVSIKKELNLDRKRECLMRAEALTPQITTNRFTDTESFNIMLQSSFVDNDDRNKLLKVSGNIQDKTVKQVSDDGTSQAVTIKAGVANVADVRVPNPVLLAPFRTFPEVKQPESKFIFRMKDGPSCALYEADGGAWRNVAMENIKTYLKANLAEFKNVKIIS
ncbi:hypothetical protein [Clostridium culturomicium]|uniref:hypothetical protein n=1 Tax=Clostridium culturomicium TaxID=1499683 RepID=UPI0005911BF5|nr:hypothetical protein [Clostridium culturomicium]